MADEDIAKADSKVCVMADKWLDARKRRQASNTGADPDKRAAFIQHATAESNLAEAVEKARRARAKEN